MAEPEGEKQQPPETQEVPLFVPKPKYACTRPPQFDAYCMNGLVYCSDCGSDCEIGQAQIKSKVQGTWKCNKCNVVHSKLFRG